MPNIDLFVVWPSAVDFPLYREWLENNKKTFNHIFVSISQSHRRLDFTEFLTRELSKIENLTAISTETFDSDWRSYSVNKMLNISNSKYCLFMEQDFLISKESLFAVLEESEKHDGVVIPDGNRFHPCFLLLKRSVIDSTSKDFAPDTPEYDHFGRFSQEIANRDLISINAIISEKDYYHMAGLTYNYLLAMDGQPPNHNLYNFLVYNAASRVSGVKQDERYVALSISAESLLTNISLMISTPKERT